jgi:hydrogenase maturation protein HypF
VQHLTLPVECRPTLAVGADIVSAPCIANGKECWILDPVSDLSLVENFETFKLSVDTLIKKAMPEQIVCDLHPGYFSTQYAEALSRKLNIPLIRVQHHRAHAASCAAEYGLLEYAAIVCDGLGYGDDGTLWGGEVFDGAPRIGCLEPQSQLGGDSATLYPKRMLFGILAKFMDQHQLLRFYAEDEIKLYTKQLNERFNVFTTTSCGRILDAASALLGFCAERTYEGEPAIRLEKKATGQPFTLKPVIRNAGYRMLNTTVLFRFLVDNLDEDKGRLASTVHHYLADGLYELVQPVNKPVVFSGGVAHNKIISGLLEERGVLMHRQISPGDAGIAFGQAYLVNIKDSRQDRRVNIRA